MYHPIVKEQIIPGQLEGLQTNPDTIETASASQHDTSAILVCLWISRVIAFVNALNRLRILA